MVSVATKTLALVASCDLLFGSFAPIWISSGALGTGLSESLGFALSVGSSLLNSDSAGISSSIPFWSNVRLSRSRYSRICSLRFPSMVRTRWSLRASGGSSPSLSSSFLISSDSYSLAQRISWLLSALTPIRSISFEVSLLRWL